MPMKMLKLLPQDFGGEIKMSWLLCLRNRLIRICRSMIDLEFRDFISSMVEGGIEREIVHSVKGEER